MPKTTQLIAILTLTILVNLPLAAALGGVPERPVPGRAYPELWLAHVNDSLGHGGEDDRRTAAFNAGLRHQRWLVFLDYAILTDLDGSDLRTDEITASLGALVVEHQGLFTAANDRFDLALGAGLRLTGDFGGEALQNSFHDLIGQEDTILPYEDADPDGVFWLSSEWTAFAPAEGPWRAGIALALRALSTTDGAATWSPEATLFVQHRWAEAWIGIRHESRFNDAATTTQTAVREAEDGTWLSYGVRVLNAPYFRVGHNLDTQESFGTVGITWTWR